MLISLFICVCFGISFPFSCLYCLAVYMEERGWSSPVGTAEGGARGYLTVSECQALINARKSSVGFSWHFSLSREWPKTIYFSFFFKKVVCFYLCLVFYLLPYCINCLVPRRPLTSLLCREAASVQCILGFCVGTDPVGYASLQPLIWDGLSREANAKTKQSLGLSLTNLWLRLFGLRFVFILTLNTLHVKHDSALHMIV